MTLTAHDTVTDKAYVAVPRSEWGRAWDEWGYAAGRPCPMPEDHPMFHGLDGYEITADGDPK